MKGNYSEAIKLYSRAIELDGSRAMFYFGRAFTYNKMRSFEQVIEDCQRAIEIDTRHSMSYNLLGDAYSNLQHYQEAIENFKKAQELEPSNELYKINLQSAEKALAIELKFLVL